MHISLSQVNKPSKSISQLSPLEKKKKEVGWMDGLNNIHRRLVNLVVLFHGFIHSLE